MGQNFPLEQLCRDAYLTIPKGGAHLTTRMRPDTQDSHVFANADLAEQPFCQMRRPLLEGAIVTRTNLITLTAACVLFGAALDVSTAAPPKSAPLVIGETFTLDSRRLEEARRINVY